MAGRRSALVTINDPKSRDVGKQFRVTEMSADAAERWAIRALLAFANAGARLPEGMLGGGMAAVQATLPGLVIQGMQSLAGLRYEDAAPLLDEMMGCVDFKAPGVENTFMSVRGAGMSQIEEVSTLMRLRYETLQVHVDFSLADAFSTSREPSPASPSN